MSTRCRIGILNKDGTVTSIYCHHDGYPDGVGEVLVKQYDDENKIRGLLQLGDISSIGTEPISNPRAWDTPDLNNWKEQHPEDMCDTYASRGEDCPAKIHKSIEEYQKHSRNCWGEYAYLFKDGEWFVMEYDDKSLNLVKNYL